MATAWDTFNSYLETGSQTITNFFSPPKPKNARETRFKNGMGFDWYPKGVGVEVVGRAPMPPKYKNQFELDRANQADTYGNATRRIVIPRGKDFAGVAPEALGLTATGTIPLANIDDLRADFTTKDSYLNNAGWASAVAAIQVLDSRSFRKEANDTIENH